MKIISSRSRNSVISLLEGGMSAKKVAKRVGLVTTTVSKIRERYLPNLPTSRGGRTCLVPESKKRQIKRSILSGSLKTAVEVHRDLVQGGYEVSYSTATRVLKSMGFEAKIKKKKPFLSKRHQALCLKWAKEYESWIGLGNQI